jgi:hypothetical protein
MRELGYTEQREGGRREGGGGCRMRKGVHMREGA